MSSCQQQSIILFKKNSSILNLQYTLYTAYYTVSVLQNYTCAFISGKQSCYRNKNIKDKQTTDVSGLEQSHCILQKSTQALEHDYFSVLYIRQQDPSSIMQPASAQLLGKPPLI